MMSLQKFFTSFLLSALVFAPYTLCRAQWVNTNAPHSQPTRCFATSRGILYAGIDMFGVARSSHGDSVWNIGNSGLPIFGTSYFVSALASIDSEVFAASGGVCRSTDSGTTWTPTITNSSATGIGRLAFCGSDLFAVIGSDSVFLSSDRGNSWVLSNKGLPTAVDVVTELAANDSNVFEATEDHGVFRWSYHDSTWTAIDSGLTSLKVTAIAAKGARLLAATYDDGVLVSTNNGASWKAVNRFVDTTIVFMYASGNNMFALARLEGVFLSIDGGKSWKSVNEGLDVSSGSNQYNALVSDNTYLYLGTASGVFRRRLSEMIGQDAVAKTEVTNKMLRCYPNPFSRSTTISFAPETSGHADISIINQLGVEVASIFSGELDASEHSFNLNIATSLSDGQYECVIRMKGHVEKMPLVLLR